MFLLQNIGLKTYWSVFQLDGIMIRKSFSKFSSVLSFMILQIFLLKKIFGFNSLIKRPTWILVQSSNNRTRDHKLKLIKARFHCDECKNFFSNRILYVWNSLWEKNHQCSNHLSIQKPYYHKQPNFRLSLRIISTGLTRNLLVAWPVKIFFSQSFF